MSRVLRLSQPSTEPVTLDQAKTHLRVDIDASDDEITAWISAAREHVEQFCNRAFCEATFAVIYDGLLPAGSSALFVPMPGATIDGITYVDADGVTQAFSDYTFDAERQEVAPDDSWPAGTSLRVAVSAGDDDNVPYPVFAAILLYIGDMYQHRMAQVQDAKLTENMAAERLLMPYRVEMGI